MKILDEHVKMRNSVNRKFNHGVTVSDTKYRKKVLQTNSYLQQLYRTIKLFQIKLCM